MFYKLVDYVVTGDGGYITIDVYYIGTSGSTQSETMRLRTIQWKHSPNWFTTVREKKHVS